MKKSSLGSSLIRSCCFIALFTLLLVFGGFLTQLLPPNFSSPLVYGLFGSFAAVLLLIVVVRLESITLIQTGLTFNWLSAMQFFWGLLIGTSIFLILILGMYLGNATVRINEEVKLGKLLLSLVPFIPLAFMEEIGFRSYPFFILQRRAGLILTQFFIAVLFAAYHLLNGWSVAAAFLGPFVWSFAFGYVCLRTGSIWTSFGFHLALNWMQNLFGMKGNFSGLFVINSQQNMSVDWIGIGLHVLIFLVFCWLTIRYDRKTRSA